MKIVQILEKLKVGGKHAFLSDLNYLERYRRYNSIRNTVRQYEPALNKKFKVTSKSLYETVTIERVK